MLKSLYTPRQLRFPDANQNEGGSSETFRTVGESTETAVGDEMGASNGSEANASKDENGGKSMLDAVKEQLKSKGHDVESASNEDETTAESSTAEDENAEESGSENERDKKGEEQKQDENENENEEQTGEEEKEVKADEKEKEKEKAKPTEEKLLSGKDPIPVDRFKEVITQRNTIREQLTQAQPILDDWRALDTFCKQNSISPQQFNEMIQTQALLNTDPVKALPKLKALVSELEGFTGERLPDDLQAAVDAGELSLKYAKEVAQTRAQTKFGSKKLEHDQARFQEQQQAMLQRQLNDAASTWETTKRTSDPDYKPKANSTDPDGKWEMVKAQFISMLNDRNDKGEFVNPVKTPAEMTSLMDKAYSSVSASLARFTRRPATRKPIRSDGSSNGNERTNGKSIEDQPDLQSAVRVGLKQMGHRF